MQISYVSNDAISNTVDFDYLKRYPIIVIAGSQEYSSHDQINVFKRYVLKGAVLFLSAREC